MDRTDRIRERIFFYPVCPVHPCELSSRANRHEERLATTIDEQEERFVPCALDGCDQVGGRARRLLVGGEDHVALLQAGLCGGAGRVNAADDHPFNSVAEVELARDLRRQRRDGDAELAALLGALLVAALIVAVAFRVRDELSQSSF